MILPNDNGVVGPGVASGAAARGDALWAAVREGPSRGGVVWAAAGFVQCVVRRVFRHDQLVF